MAVDGAYGLPAGCDDEAAGVGGEGQGWSRQARRRWSRSFAGGRSRCRPAARRTRGWCVRGAASWYALYDRVIRVMGVADRQDVRW